MQNERLRILLELDSTDKQDVTTKYMLAIEYLNSQDSKCEDYFDTLFKDFEDYLPTYYIAGEYYYNQEEYQKSVDILKKGLEVAKKCNNQKTYNEIQNLLMNVEFEL